MAGGYSIPGAWWDMMVTPPANQQTMQNTQYTLPQVNLGMTGGDPTIGGPLGRPMNGPYPNGGVPPLPVQNPMAQVAPPSYIHPVNEILTNPEGVAAKAAAAGIRPPPIEGTPGANGAEGADWTAELMSGSPPAAGSNLSNEGLAKGFGAVTGQESGIAQRPSGSANVSVGTDTPGKGAGGDALQYLMSLMMSGGGGKTQNLRDLIGSR
jgi:hypothetical protein